MKEKHPLMLLPQDTIPDVKNHENHLSTLLPILQQNQENLLEKRKESSLDPTIPKKRYE